MNTLEVNGVQFSWEVRDDANGLGAPWEENDCHGPVSKWQRSSSGKAPGQMVLHEDRGSRRLYDFAAACRIARKEWGCKTRKDAADAAMQDFRRLRAWCRGDWYWCGVVVKFQGETRSIWGVESDAVEYHVELARELAEELLAELQFCVMCHHTV